METATSMSGPLSGGDLAQGGRGLPEATVGIVLLVIGIGFLITAVWRDWIRPGSFRRAMARDALGSEPGGGRRVRSVDHIEPFAPFGFAGGVFVVSLIAAVAGKAVADGLELSVQSLSGTAVIMMVTYAFSAPAAVGLMIVSDLMNRQRVRAGALPEVPATVDGRARRGMADIGVGLALVIPVAGVLAVVGSVSTIVMHYWTGKVPDQLAHELLKRLASEEGQWASAAVIVCGAIGAPIVEEIMFRGFLQTGLRRVTGSPWTAILITSALFALVHVTAVPVYALPTLAVMGITLGVLMERRGVWACIALHAAWNTVQFAFALALHS